VGTPRPPALVAFLLAIALSVLAAPVLSAGTESEDEITPSTAVARLKIVKGTAWVRPADSGEWEEYIHNSPVVERSRVSIPKGSEAEVQFRGSQFLLLQGGSEVDVRQLGERKASFRLRAGQVAFSLSKEDFAPVAVKLPGSRDVSLDVPGLYWLTVDGETTKLNVRHGEGTVSGEGAQPVAVKEGDEASIDKEIRVSHAGPPDIEPAPETTLTEEERKAGIPPTAATELRGYGEWVWTSEYGYVWRPYVADGWAPYYYGRWTWVYPYGWNWVGYEPWGWWPYHYGWWVSFAAYGWVWAPCNTFYSAGYYYRGYPYSYRYGYYYPANVRFVNNGRTIRWVPAQPGQGTTRTTTYSRSDTRLARWDRPIPGGMVTPRGGGGRLPAAGGQGAAGMRARTGGSAGLPQTDRGIAGPSSARRSAGGTGREAIGRSAGQSRSRPSPEGGGQVSAVPSGTGPQGRPARVGEASSRYSAPGGKGHAPAYRGSAWNGRGGEPRGYGRGYANTPARGYDSGSRGMETAPRGSFGAGYRGMEGAVRSFGEGGSRGYPGGSRVLGGGWGGGWGGRGQGGGFSGGGGVRMR